MFYQKKMFILLGLMAMILINVKGNKIDPNFNTTININEEDFLAAFIIVFSIIASIIGAVTGLYCAYICFKKSNQRKKIKEQMLFLQMHFASTMGINVHQLRNDPRFRHTDHI